MKYLPLLILYSLIAGCATVEPKLTVNKAAVQPVTGMHISVIKELKVRSGNQLLCLVDIGAYSKNSVIVTTNDFMNESLQTDLTENKVNDSVRKKFEGFGFEPRVYFLESEYKRKYDTFKDSHILWIKVLPENCDSKTKQVKWKAQAQLFQKNEQLPVLELGTGYFSAPTDMVFIEKIKNAMIENGFLIKQ